MKKTCGSCKHFQKNGPMDPQKPNGIQTGECRAHSPIILTHLVLPQGPNWIAGWPPCNSEGWCGEHAPEILSAVPAMRV